MRYIIYARYSLESEFNTWQVGSMPTEEQAYDYIIRTTERYREKHGYKEFEMVFTAVPDFKAEEHDELLRKIID
jgi:hypothetical protein